MTSSTVEPTVQWSQDQMVEVTLNEPDDFLKVRETLTRIGVASRKEKKLYQSCHILHKQGKYYIVHFKELFALDGKNQNLFLILLHSIKSKFFLIKTKEIGFWNKNIILERKERQKLRIRNDG